MSNSRVWNKIGMESQLYILKVLTFAQSSVQTDVICRGQSHPAGMVGLWGKDNLISSDILSRFADLLSDKLFSPSALWSSSQYGKHHYLALKSALVTTVQTSAVPI